MISKTLLDRMVFMVTADNKKTEKDHYKTVAASTLRRKGPGWTRLEEIQQAVTFLARPVHQRGRWRSARGPIRMRKNVVWATDKLSLRHGAGLQLAAIRNRRHRGADPKVSLIISYNLYMLYWKIRGQSRARSDSFMCHACRIASARTLVTWYMVLRLPTFQSSCMHDGLASWSCYCTEVAIVYNCKVVLHHQIIVHVVINFCM